MNLRSVLGIGLIVACSTGVRAPAAVAASSVPILDFHIVAKDVYRGARPDAVGMQALANLGIKTDLDLESKLDYVDQEMAAARPLKIDVISIPMSGFWTPKDADVNRALQVLSDPSRYPIFVHCEHGHDRTGLIVGLFRIENQNWKPADSFAEMQDLGFHRSLFLINHYFEERTGFED